MLKPSGGALVAAMLAAVAGLPYSVWAQEAAPAAQPTSAPVSPASLPVPADPAPAKPAEKPAEKVPEKPAAKPGAEVAPPDQISFNFKNTPVDQALDVFAREAGIPIIFEAAAPEGGITFVSASTYTFDEALSILNLNLQRYGVHVRREREYLYLSTLADAMKKAVAIPSSVAKIEGLTPDLVITVNIPLDNARVEQVVETVKQMVGPFGGVIPIPAQNMLVVVESAAQVRRIREVVSAIDAVKPADAAYRLFPLKHAQADTVLNALKGLVAERSKTVIVDKDGSQRVVQDQQLQGLNLVADPRTNSIVAVGPEARIRTVEEVIELLDVEAGTGGKGQMATFALAAAAPEQVAQQLGSLFNSRDPKSRPVVLALPQAAKVTIVGTGEDIRQAGELIAQIDPGSAPAGSQIAMPERRSVTIGLEHAKPEAIEATLTKLMNESARRQVRTAATPDGHGLILMGPSTEVTPLEAIVHSLDVEPSPDREVRVVRIAGNDPDSVLKRAQTLYAQSGKSEKQPVQATLIAEAGAAALVGTREALAAFEPIVTASQAAMSRGREIRLMDLKLAKAGEVAEFLRDLAKSSRSLLAGDGPEPVIEVIESTNQLLIGGTGAQLSVIDSLVKNLDAKQTGDRPPLRILTVRTTDAANLAAVLQKSFDSRPQEARAAKPVTVEADPATNTLIVSAHPDALTEIEGVVERMNEAQAKDAAGREIRIFPLKAARADELAQTIDQMFPEPPVPLDPRTRQPRYDLKQPKEVTVRADRATNSLIVDAPARRLTGFEQLVASLDRQRPSEDVLLRTYRVQQADLNSVANTLRQLAAGGALAAPGPGAPITVSTEPLTRTLIVSGPPAAFKAVEEVLAKVDASAPLPATDLKLFSLTTARADRIQPVIERVLSARAREMLMAAGTPPAPDQKLVEVASDVGSNSLIVTAPREVLAIAEGLVRSMDQTSVASATEVRVFRLTKGSAATVAPALGSALHAQDAPGATAATITPEPGSNTLVVVGSGEQLTRAAKLIEQLDASTDREGLGVRTIPLKHARAEGLAPVLESVLARESSLDRMPDWMRAQVLARGNPEPVKVRVAAEPRLNAVIVSGPQALLDTAEEVVRTLDIDSAGGETSRTVRVISVQNADAGQLAGSLDAVFRDGQATQTPPVIRVEPASNSLIVRGTTEQMRTMDELVKKLDAAAAGTSRQLRAVPLDRSRADADLMARALQRLLEQQGGAKVEIISAEELLKRTRGNSPAAPTKDAEPAKSDEAPKKTGDAGVSAMPAWLRAVTVAAIAADPDPAPATTPGAQPEPAPAAAPEPATQPAASDEGGVTIAVDRATNTLLIVGSPRMTDRLAALAATLERQMPAEPTSVRLIGLPPGVDAWSITQLVRSTLDQLGRANASNPGGLTGNVSITPEPSGDGLIVVCNPTDFETVGSLIANVSQPGQGAKVTLKVYPLQSVTAQRAIDAVRDLFSSTPRGAQARGVRAIQLSLNGDKGEIAGKIDPALVRLTSSPAGTAVIVAAPDEALPIIDRLIETIDQSPVKDRLAIRRYEVTHAKAGELARTMQSLFDAQRQGPTAWELPQARFVADDRTNTLLVTASEPQHKDVARILADADQELNASEQELAFITLRQASPMTARSIVEEVLVGRDPARKDRLRISTQDGSSLLVVRASKSDMAEVRQLIEQIDKSDTSGLPVRTVKVERADAAAVATAITKFFSDRAAASGRAGQRGANRLAVVGDKRSGTLVVAAGDDDYALVQSLVSNFDAPASTQGFQFKVLPLKHARASEVSTTLKEMVDDMRWEGVFSNRADEKGGRVYIEANERTNSLVVMGEGEELATIERVIGTLDLPDAERAAMTFRGVKVKSADMRALQSAIQRAFATPGWRFWRGPDPDAVAVEIDRGNRTLILMGKAERVQQAADFIGQLDKGPENGGGQIESITLDHARADRTAQSLRQFFADRARAQGLDQPTVNIVGSPDGNVLLASGDADSMKTLRDLVAQIDQPDGGKDRRTDVVVLRNASAGDVAASLRAMFARDSKGDDRVVITPQPSTNSVIISAPATVYPEVATLLAQLDAAPKAEESNIETVPLTSARAVEVATALKQALPPNVKVTVTPVARSNSLLLTGSKEAIAIAMDQIKKIDTEPVRSGQVFRRFKLESAEAAGVSFTLEQLLRARPRNATDPGASVDYSRSDNTVTVYAPADQIEEIEKIIRELDTSPVEERTTEFVKLEYASAPQAADALKVFYGRSATEAANAAARQVTILPDALSNSLVIRADKTQWEGIRALLAKLDTKEYDTTRQLAVIALEHADAASVAKALNDGLRAPLEEQVRQARARADQNRPRGNNARPWEGVEPAVLVDADGVPSVSAEPQTNSLIVFAGRRELERVQAIVKQLDVTGFGNLPMARIIPLKTGKPSTVAGNIRQLYLNQTDRVNGPRSVLVIGDDASGALIVRADDEKFAQIKTLAETLEQQGEIGRVQPHVVKLKSAAAGRLRTTILATFTETAKSQGETLAVEVDRASNSLVIACSARLLEQIKQVIEELDAALPQSPDGINPALSQSVTIVDVANNAPADIRKQLEEMGVTRPQAADRVGIVSEPVSLIVMSSRRAIAVVGAPSDGRLLESVIRALDAAPSESTQSVAVIPLKIATAKPLADTLTQMLRSGPEGDVSSPAGKALAEQVRRLQLIKNGVDQPKEPVDLSKPIRVMADVEANAIILASTPGNIEALREVVKSLDVLPAGEAVVLRIFPLENASATRVRQVIEQLFAQGEQLRRIPGTRRQGLPPTATGQALAGELAASVDERTNTLIVAGREEAVALVEVLVKDLDSDQASKWVEPMVLPLKHADAASMARRLQEVLVRGMSATPEAVGLQRQFGRLRIAQQSSKDGPKAISPGAPAAPANANVPAVNADAPGSAQDFVEADLFAPITGLAISADETLNALLVVGSPANLAVVRSLAEQLDVPAASAANTVRVFPLRFAAAERVSNVLRDVFRQRRDAQSDRAEDALIVTSDVRTNSLIISTSVKSFAIVESLLKTLDGEKSNFSVGLHVIPVTGADVRQLAPRIERLMRERIQAAATVGSVRSSLDAFSIEAEPTSNLLVVAASDENLQVVKELIKALGEDSKAIADGERVDIIQLAKARAAEVATSLQTMYVEKENQRRGSAAVHVAPNERLNALIISGNEQDLIELRALAKKLDSAEVAQKQQIRWIELKSASATEVTRLVESVLAGRPVGGGRGVGARQATRLQFLRDEVRSDLLEQKKAAPTEADIDGAIKDLVTLTPDARTNSVWITAPEPLVKLISEMIEDIEKSSAGQRKIEKFRLVNSDAVKMRDLLRDIFNLEQKGDALVLVPAGRPDRKQPDEGGPDQPAPVAVESQSVTPVTDERQQLAIAVDQRTNTLIVSGTPDYLDLVRKVVTDLDSITANDRERRVYHLRNAKAKEIETTLKSYFQGEADKTRLTLGAERAGSLVKRLEEEVTVVGDEASNKLVISTSPRYMESVLKIVDELDQSPPQVMIQVLLAEVTIDAGEQWGMDFNVGPFGGDGYRIGSTAQGVGVATALGVPNLSVSSADFGVLIRALELQGKLEVLSNPQVLANNNKTAEIKVVDNIGVAGRTQSGLSNGTVISEVDRLDAGIILKVTPSISSDGFVRMEIAPEISQLSARTTQVNRDQTSPIITKRTVDTVVTIKDGQSVVIGGLIQTSDEQRNTKVPLLGDIPILGLPFRTKANTAQKTELLVILTPRVMPVQAAETENLVRDVTDQAVDRLEDPTRIQDYLDRIRDEVRRAKERNGGYVPTETLPAARPLDDPAPSEPAPRSNEVPAQPAPDNSAPPPTPAPQPSWDVPSRPGDGRGWDKP